MESTTRAQAGAITETEVDELWRAFGVFDTDGNGEISAEELGQVMHALGQAPSLMDLRALIKEVDVEGSGTVDFEEFKALMIAQQGDRQSRLKLAYSIFDQDNNNHITAAELQTVMGRFGLSEGELTTMVKEVDLDGDGVIGFEEFCLLAQDQATSANVGGSISGSIAAGTTPNPSSNSAPEPVGKAAQRMPMEADTETQASQEIERLKALLALHPQEEKAGGTSRLQMQIGLFRLIQGAAYRCFRESFSANHETHLQVRNLPYRITDFARFVQTAIRLYKGLGIVEPACDALLDAVVDSITMEVARLGQRIENWPTLDKSPAMLLEEEAMVAARSASGNAREKFAAGIDFAITMKKRKFYTTRYWPSIDSELARATALKQISIATRRLMAIYGLLKPVARLSAVRLQLQNLLEAGDQPSLDGACALARQHIQALEEAVIEGGFLQDTYRFDPELVDQAPAFTPEEEAFGRTNLFIEV